MNRKFTNKQYYLLSVLILAGFTLIGSGIGMLTSKRLQGCIIGGGLGLS